MMKIQVVLIILITISLTGCSSSDQEYPRIAFPDSVRDSLLTEFRKMAIQDQLNRSYLTIGTLDEKLIDSVNNLSKLDQIKFTAINPSTLTNTQIDSLEDQQRAIDLKNTEELIGVIKKYGWVSSAKMDSLFNPMQFLFHTPKPTISTVRALLYKEVMNGRMHPFSYATYVDNMRKKAYRQNQLYGTGDEFDVETRQIVPPYLDDLDSTNNARVVIGLARLKDGEYRLSKK